MQKLTNNNGMRVGTAGWSIAEHNRINFPNTGSVLQKYATRFNAVEVNSSFYRSHKQSTYENWSSQVAEDFAFSVKLPRRITHHLKLRDIQEPLEQFAEEIKGLGAKLGCVLVQLPPSLEFAESSVLSAFALLREAFSCPIVCEPRHQSWFSSEVEEVLTNAGVARAATDPAICPPASVPGGDTRTCYYRLHGSPDIYYSDYTDDKLQAFAQLIVGHVKDSEIWCMFDNSALGHSTKNALKMQQRLRE